MSIEKFIEGRWYRSGNTFFKCLYVDPDGNTGTDGNQTFFRTSADWIEISDPFLDEFDAKTPRAYAPPMSVQNNFNQQQRFQAACSAMQALIVVNIPASAQMKAVGLTAVAYADALLEALTRERK